MPKPNINQKRQKREAKYANRKISRGRTSPLLGSIALDLATSCDRKIVLFMKWKDRLQPYYCDQRQTTEYVMYISDMTTQEYDLISTPRHKDVYNPILNKTTKGLALYNVRISKR